MRIGSGIGSCLWKGSWLTLMKITCPTPHPSTQAERWVSAGRFDPVPKAPLLPHPVLPMSSPVSFTLIACLPFLVLQALSAAATATSSPKQDRSAR